MFATALLDIEHLLPRVRRTAMEYGGQTGAQNTTSLRQQI